MPTLSFDEAKVRQHLEGVLAECFKMYKGQFREVCLGFEVALKELAEKGVYLKLLQLDFYQDAIKIGAVELLSEQPSAYHLDAVWAVIYACLTPRHTPFGGDPLRVRSLEIGHGMSPRITYDADFDNGLPMSLDRPYDPEKVKGATKR